MALTFLWTDILLWLVSLFAVSYVYFIRKSTQLSLKWRQVFISKIAVVSFIIFIFYLSIALLDSIHFKDGVKIYSALDNVLEHSYKNGEKTYSAPLDYQLFSKEYLEDGTRGRKHLKYAANNITNDTDNIVNILKLSFYAFIKWLIFIALLLLVIFKFKRKYLKSQVAITTISTIAVLLLICFFIAQITPHYHIFGTDKAGGDVFYSAIKGIRTGMVFAILTTAIATPIAIILGLAAGYFQGKTDDVIQFIYTTINAIPGILLIAALVVILQAYMEQNADLFNSNADRSDMKLLLLCLVLALTSWTGLCRLVRAETLKVKSLEFVSSAKIFNISNQKILMSYILPNVAHLILITMVLDFSALVLAEAVLAYIGIGVDATTMSWGNMVNSARLELSKEPAVWWSLLAAFSLMFILVLCVNLLADNIREVFDDKNK